MLQTYKLLAFLAIPYQRPNKSRFSTFVKVSSHPWRHTRPINLPIIFFRMARIISQIDIHQHNVPAGLNFHPIQPVTCCEHHNRIAGDRPEAMLLPFKLPFNFDKSLPVILSRLSLFSNLVFLQSSALRVDPRQETGDLGEQTFTPRPPGEGKSAVMCLTWLGIGTISSWLRRLGAWILNFNQICLVRLMLPRFTTSPTHYRRLLQVQAVVSFGPCQIKLTSKCLAGINCRHTNVGQNRALRWTRSQKTARLVYVSKCCHCHCHTGVQFSKEQDKTKLRNFLLVEKQI